jgi:adenosylcobinamide kinase/adenosylcobinamide-phosphate guanylyltransferase
MSPRRLPSLTLVLGGAASGKSAFAEKLIIESGLDRVYLATGQAFDDEMKAKVIRHQHMRGPGWTTLEAPLDLPKALAGRAPGQAVLVDCLTMWLSNQLLADTDTDAGRTDLTEALRGLRGRAPVVLVSNEVGQGIVPENALARRFREAQGALNQAMAAEADLVVAVMAGLPLVLKGELPA